MSVHAVPYTANKARYSTDSAAGKGFSRVPSGEPSLTVQDVLSQQDGGLHCGVVRADADPAHRSCQAMMPEGFNQARLTVSTWMERIYHRRRRQRRPGKLSAMVEK